jgi:hypothetical protein
MPLKVNYSYPGPTLSEKAAAVTSAGQAWDLFFTDEMLNIIVDNTNR